MKLLPFLLSVSMDSVDHAESDWHDRSGSHGSTGFSVVQSDTFWPVTVLLNANASNVLTDLQQSKLDVVKCQMRSFIRFKCDVCRWQTNTVRYESISSHKSFHLGEVQFRFKWTHFLTRNEKSQAVLFGLYSQCKWPVNQIYVQYVSMWHHNTGKIGKKLLIWVNILNTFYV